MSTKVLVRFEFGKFGNYGSQLVLQQHDNGESHSLALENWAYGETSASVTTYEGVTADNLEKLGKELIQAASQLKSAQLVAR